MMPMKEPTEMQPSETYPSHVSTSADSLERPSFHDARVLDTIVQLLLVILEWWQ